jgi:predicted glycosyltransferase involved in capsule biosynthesis
MTNIQLTVITSFYCSFDDKESNNRAEICLRRQVKEWKKLPPEYKRIIEFIIVDDNSDYIPAIDFYDLPIRYFRVLDDIPWNSSGCRNLAALNVTSKWVLFHDIYNVFNVEDLKKLSTSVLDLVESKPHSNLYNFMYKVNNVYREPHLCTLLLNINYFWSLGGYDEDFAGNYGFDDAWLNYIWKEKYGPPVLIEIEPKELNLPTNGVLGGSTVRNNGMTINHEKLKLKFKEFNENGKMPFFNKKIRFRYIELPVSHIKKYAHRFPIGFSL